MHVQQSLLLLFESHCKTEAGRNRIVQAGCKPLQLQIERGTVTRILATPPEGMDLGEPFVIQSTPEVPRQDVERDGRYELIHRAFDFARSEIYTGIDTYFLSQAFRKVIPAVPVPTLMDIDPFSKGHLVLDAPLHAAHLKDPEYAADFQPTCARELLSTGCLGSYKDADLLLSGLVSDQMVFSLGVGEDVGFFQWELTLEYLPARWDEGFFAFTAIAKVWLRFNDSPHIQVYRVGPEATISA